MAKVFVTQVPLRKDKDTGAFAPSVNIAPAAEFGEVVVMMPPRAPFFATADLKAQLYEHLKNYSLDGNDYIVALGDPVVIAVAFALLGKYKGAFNVLKWDRNTQRYVSSRVNV